MCQHGEVIELTTSGLCFRVISSCSSLEYFLTSWTSHLTSLKTKSPQFGLASNRNHFPSWIWHRCFSFSRNKKLTRTLINFPSCHCVSRMWNFQITPHGYKLMYTFSSCTLNFVGRPFEWHTTSLLFFVFGGHPLRS